MSKRAERKQALEASLMRIATSQIRENGLGAVTARSLAAEVGCAVGSIYTAFDDLNDLFLAVNMETAELLAAQIAEQVFQHDPETPEEQLVVLGQAYLDFAMAEQNLWRALFEIDIRADMDVPETYLNAMNGLMGLIAAPLIAADASLDEGAAETRARALFSAVHGIVTLGLERRISAVSPDQMREMIAFVLQGVTKITD